jgi:hypothetical protein
VHVHGPAVGGEVAVPDLPDQVGPAEHRRRVRGEEGEQLELLVGERDLGAVDPDPPLIVVEQQPRTIARGLGALGLALPSVAGDQVRPGGARPGGHALRRRHRVADDRQRRAGAGNRHHGEQGAVRARRPHPFWPGPGVVAHVRLGAA